MERLFIWEGEFKAKQGHNYNEIVNWIVYATSSAL